MLYPNIHQLTRENTYFRKVIFTDQDCQGVVMSIPPGEDIGLETHDDVDQVLLFVKGSGQALLGGKASDFVAGDLANVPAGTEHNFINTGTEDLKVFTIYSPPEHPDGVVHETKADALAHPDE